VILLFPIVWWNFAEILAETTLIPQGFRNYILHISHGHGISRLLLLAYGDAIVGVVTLRPVSSSVIVSVSYKPDTDRFPLLERARGASASITRFFEWK
jgi:hypothetical protein